MKKFKLKRYSSSKNNCSTNILDIYYQKNKIVAYVKGSHIYKTELIIRSNRIENYYCSCPSCQGGMNFCKHLISVENYLDSHEIPELCTQNKFPLDIYNYEGELLLEKIKIITNKILLINAIKSWRLINS